MFGWDITIWKSGIWGCKAIKILRKSPLKLSKFLAMHITKQKYIFDPFTVEFTKYLHGTWSLLNTLMIVGVKENSILTHTMYFWLLLQTYPCYLRLVLWSRVTCHRMISQGLCEQLYNKHSFKKSILNCYNIYSLIKLMQPGEHMRHVCVLIDLLIDFFYFIFI